MIWIGSDPRGLPGQCGLIVDTAADRTARVVELDGGIERGPIRLDTASASTAEVIARSLAPIRDASSADSSASIPSRVRLLDLLGLEAPSGERLCAVWHTHRRGLRATIGAGARAALAVDLRSDGPHALVAGTTGAGKSELLRTLVAALAAQYPPSRLNFILVDYKGGAAFAPCAAFPHVLDVVSDLDAELGERALISLDAEMKRRERLLAELRADNLIDLERRALDQAPPNLVIMVDEFAKLRDEVPEFIDGVVDVAQRGRTLGIHMVLAAQSLRTAFTPAVRANTNLRIALRVTSETESQDVLDAPEAARIPSGDTHRGRAFVRIGHEQLIEFQTAHVSGRYSDPTGAEALARPFGFSTPLRSSGRRGDTGDLPPESDETDLAVLAGSARRASQLLGLGAPRPAWMPPLPRQLSRAQVQCDTSAASGRCAVGLVDDPQSQRQMPLVLDLDRGHVAFFGIGGSGKTTVLQTIAASLAWDLSPARLHIYGIDAGSGALSIITPLPHVGAVVSAGDSERIERLLARLEREIRNRTQSIVRTGAGSLTEYEERVGHADAPARIVLLIDDLGSFATAYDDARPGSLFERLLAIVAAGRTLGVHVILTADRRNAIRSSLGTHVTQRVVLQGATSDDLVALGVPTRLADRVHLSPGRGFTPDGKIVQLALPSPSSEDDLVTGYEALGAHLQKVWPELTAPPVARLPERLPFTNLPGSKLAAVEVPVAFDVIDLEPRALNIADRHCLIAGPYRSGRSTTLGVITRQLTSLPEVEELHLLAPRRTPLLELDVWEAASRGSEACQEMSKLLADRTAQLADSDLVRLAVIVDDAGELQDASTWLALEQIVRLGRDRGVRVVAAAETSAARMLTNTWLRELRKDGQGILLMPQAQADGDILGVALPRRQNVEMRPGRGYLVVPGQATLVQVPAGTGPMLEGEVQAPGRVNAPVSQFPGRGSPLRK